jgi:chemotaxis protein CheX
MKAEYINPFLKSTIETFKTMVNLAIKPGKIYLRSDTDAADVYAEINISGNLDGSIVMAYPRDTAIKVSSRFLGEEVRELNANAIDCVGELANIVTGFAKKDLHNLRLVISLPSVVQNREEVNVPKGVPIVCVPFDSDAGRFIVEVCYL